MPITTHGCEPLFAAFSAAALNAKETIQGMGYIVQNDGVPLSFNEINNWAEQETKRLLAQHREQLQLITDTVAALKGMPTKKVLGYRQNGEPIHELTGGIATACIISCHGCGKVIRGMGGPAHGALCPDCWEAKGL